MQKGLKLVHRIPGRAGWELRAVVQSASRVLAKTRALGGQALTTRPRLTKVDAPGVLWRMTWM